MLQTNEMENVKKVLFGNQRQADVINDAVANYIGETITKNNLGSISTVSDVRYTIEEYLSRCICKPELIMKMFVRLLVGDAGYDILVSGQPSELETSQPNPDSPKFTFRIIACAADVNATRADMLDENLLNGQPTAKWEIPTESTLDERLANNDLLREINTTHGSPVDSFAARADYLKNVLSDLIPETIKREVPDPYAQALLVAVDYRDTLPKQL